MRKRLRKKKRLGEFIEYGFFIDGTWIEKYSRYAGINNPIIDLQDQFVAAVIDLCEINKLTLGGGTNGETFGFFITKGYYRSRWCPRRWKNISATEDDRNLLQNFLASRPELAKFVVGELVDAWK